MNIGIIIGTKYLMDKTLKEVINKKLSDNNISYEKINYIDYLYSINDFLDNMFNHPGIVYDVDKFIVGNNLVINNNDYKDIYKYIDKIEDNLHMGDDIDDTYVDIVVLLNID